MRAFVAVTDSDWFRFLSQHAELTEINFWQPGGGRNFRALAPGQPMLFKLHAPHNYIVGGGFFAAFSLLPATLAWETFGIKNGAATFVEMRRRIEQYRRLPSNPREDYTIGCIVLEDPFFLPERAWVPAPPDFQKNVVVGKTYDLTQPEGRALWEAVLGARGHANWQTREDHIGPMHGEPVLFRPRLGQGAFRVVVTDTYQRHCAVTGEKTLPVLEAAHIQPVAHGGLHRIDNGLLLRSDVHTLFDRGYVTVTPDLRFRVSGQLRDHWQNGRVYYQLDGSTIWVPPDPEQRPSRDALEWHADSVFKG